METEIENAGSLEDVEKTEYEMQEEAENELQNERGLSEISSPDVSSMDTSMEAASWVDCPLCGSPFFREELGEHADSCTGVEQLLPEEREEQVAGAAVKREGRGGGDERKQ